MKFEEHSAIANSWTVLSWSKSGGRFGQVSSPESIILKEAKLIREDSAIQLTRDQDEATAMLGCKERALLENLESTLKTCVAKKMTLREIGLVEVRPDLTLL